MSRVRVAFHLRLHGGELPLQRGDRDAAAPPENTAAGICLGKQGIDTGPGWGARRERHLSDDTAHGGHGGTRDGRIRSNCMLL